MKNILLLTCLMTAAMSVNAITLKEGYEEMAKLPPLKGVDELKNVNVSDGWVEALPMQDAQITVVAREKGNSQTVYYGSHVEAIANQLPDEQMVISGADFQSIVYVYASPLDADTSEVLVLVDQAYQGRTYAIYGKVNQRIVNAMKQGDVRFTPDRKVYINIPLMGFD